MTLKLNCLLNVAILWVKVHILVNYVINANFSFHKLQNNLYLWILWVWVFICLQIENLWLSGSRTNFFIKWAKSIKMPKLRRAICVLQSKNSKIDNTASYLGETESKTESKIENLSNLFMISQNLLLIIFDFTLSFT